MWYMYYKASTAHPAPYKSNKQLQTKQRPSLFHFLKHVCVAHSGKWKFRGGCRNTFIVASGCREAVKSIERTADKCRQGSRVVYIINSYNQEQSKSRNCCGFRKQNIKLLWCFHSKQHMFTKTVNIQCKD